MQKSDHEKSWLEIYEPPCIGLNGETLRENNLTTFMSKTHGILQNECSCKEIWVSHQGCPVLWTLHGYMCKCHPLITRDAWLLPDLAPSIVVHFIPDAWGLGHEGCRAWLGGSPWRVLSSGICEEMVLGLSDQGAHTQPAHALVLSARNSEGIRPVCRWDPGRLPGGVPKLCKNWVRFGQDMGRRRSFPGGSDGKESACNVGDLGWEDPLEKGIAWWNLWTEATVHGVTKSWTWLSDSHFYFH